MSKAKKIGIILMILGVGLPLVLLAFTTYDPKNGLIYNIQSMEIGFKEGILERVNRLEREGYSSSEILEELKRSKDKKLVKWIVERQNSGYSNDEILSQTTIWVLKEGKEPLIPYRYVFAAGIISMLTGIGIIVLSNNRKSGADK